ncbi:MAG: mechanosensitive ion channel [Proteobacteria bacterium]|nr:MAG: mechanosensitive ion channel [Pseudomonadota bacterium]
MPPEAALWIRGLTRAGLIFSLAVILLKMANVATSAYLRRLRVAKADNLRERKIATKIKYVEKIVDVMIVFVAIGIFLMGFDSFRRVGNSLLASAGLASLILGFAAQKSLGTLIAGLQVAFTQPIRIGDAVLVENEWGEIEEINLTYVVVRIWDLRRLVVPINYFLEKPFQNWTRTSADLVGAVLLPFDYSVPIDALRAELTRCLRASPLWDGKVNVLQVVDATDRALTVRALVSARNSGQTFDLRCEIREKLLCFVRSEYPAALPKSRFDAPGFREEHGMRMVADA